MKMNGIKYTIFKSCQDAHAALSSKFFRLLISKRDVINTF